MDVVEIFLEGQREFGARVHAVQESQWSAPTPNADWSVADLVAHLVDEHRWLPPLVHGMDLDSAGKVVQGARDYPIDGGVGANLAAAWDEAVVAAADAVLEPDVLTRSVELSSGTTAVPDYLREMTLDLVVHGWDLAVAIGYPEPPSPELVGAAWAHSLTYGELSSSSMFGERVDVAEDAPTLERLLGATGRDPAWRP